MDIVDSQVHLNRFGIEGGLAIMDALGIAATLIDDYERTDGEAYRPFDLAPGGIPRPIWPLARTASLRHPRRFAYLMRVDFRDPELDAILRLERCSPGARALRACARFPSEQEPFAAGAYQPIFTAAAQHRLPLFLNASQITAIDAYVERNPSVAVVIDHCGIADTSEKFDHLLNLARFPNLFVKWAHAPFLFGSREYPFVDLNAKLRRLIHVFGASRIMWASDASEISTGHNWSEMLYFIKANPDLSADEKAWILGKTVRKTLQWPAP